MIFPFCTYLYHSYRLSASWRSGRAQFIILISTFICISYILSLHKAFIQTILRYLSFLCQYIPFLCKYTPLLWKYIPLLCQYSLLLCQYSPLLWKHLWKYILYFSDTILFESNTLMPAPNWWCMSFGMFSYSLQLYSL